MVPEPNTKNKLIFFKTLAKTRIAIKRQQMRIWGENDEMPYIINVYTGMG